MLCTLVHYQMLVQFEIFKRYITSKMILIAALAMRLLIL